MAIRKVCSLPYRHGPHTWYEKNVFPRECPGRKRAAKEK